MSQVALKPEYVGEGHCNYPADHEDYPQEIGYALPDLQQPRPPGVGHIVELRQPTFVEHLLASGAGIELQELQPELAKEGVRTWARLAVLHHRPLLFHHDPGVRPGEVLDVRALGLGQWGGEEVDSGQLVCLTLQVDLGRLVILPYGDDHERKQHSVGDAQDREDEAG